MSCAFIIGPLPPAPIYELPPLQPLSPLDALDDLDPLPAFEGLPAVPDALPAEDAEVFDEVKVENAQGESYAVSAAPQVVSQIMGLTGALANGSQAAALNSIELLAQYTSAFTPLVAPTIPTAVATIGATGTAPEAPNLTGNFPLAPEAPSDPGAPLLDVGAPPDYAIAEIDLMDIPMPDPMDALLPTEPQLDTIGTAVEPDFNLPAVPTLLELNIPDAPNVVLPLLETAALNKPDAPNITFAYSEVEYGSTLLTAMNAKMATLVGDMTQSGLDPDVEQAIWDRAADREALLTHRATGEAVRLMKSRGFQLPEPTMVRIVQQALQGGLNRAATLQRDVAIEQARLRQANFKFALETAVSLEGRMIEKHNVAQARSLEAAKATVLAEIQIFNARVQLYQADISAFSMRASIFRSRLDAALSRIEVYKAQLEASRVAGEINTQKVAIYRAQVDGVRSIVSVFASRVDAAKQQVANTQALVDQFRSRIAAYDAQVTAKMSDYEAYAARVKGQSAKAQVYTKRVEAHKARVGAFDSMVKAQIGVQTLRFKQANEFPLALYKAKIDAYKTGVGASLEQLKTVSSIFASKIKAFSVQEGAKAEYVDAQLKVAQANAESSIASANIALEAGKANLAVAEQAAQTAQNNLRSAGQLSGQLAASAVAAQSVHASISESGSFGVSNTAGTSVSNSSNVSAMVSKGSSSSTNTSHSSTSGIGISNSRSTTEGRSYSKGVSQSYSNRKSVSNTQQVSVKNATTVEARVVNQVSTGEECTDRTIINED